MPELPEVESTRRHLEPAVVGKRIVAVEVRRSRMLRRHPDPGAFGEMVTGRRVRGLRRRGKFLLADLDGDIVWVTHLGMSGRIALAAKGDPEAPHTQVMVELGGGSEVRLVDPRTFGFVAAFTPDDLEAALGGIGPDALDDLPSSATLCVALGRRTAPIKALLLDQRIVAGLGNIYADEVLHRARLSPLRPGGSLGATEVTALRRAIRPVLDAGLRRGGTSLGDLAYLLPDGRAGEHLAHLAVYGREGQGCPRCGGEIVRTTIRARSSHWCPGCQA